jgi:hypothetical protein
MRRARSNYLPMRHLDHHWCQDLCQPTVRGVPAAAKRLFQLALRSLAQAHGALDWEVHAAQEVLEARGRTEKAYCKALADARVKACSLLVAFHPLSFSKVLQQPHVAFYGVAL